MTTGLLLLLLTPLCAQQHEVRWTNPTNTQHATWVEVAVPYAPTNAAYVNVHVGAQIHPGIKVGDSGVAASHYLVWTTLAANQTQVGQMSPSTTPLPPFVLHPEVNLTQLFPQTIEVHLPAAAGTMPLPPIVLPPVLLDGSPLKVVEQNDARVVLQTRYSTGNLHCDAYAYVSSLSPAVRFQVEIHYSDLTGGGVMFDTSLVRFVWPNTPASIEVASDLATANGFQCSGAQLSWTPPCTPDANGTGCGTVDQRIGFGERVVFDGMLLFGNDPSQLPARDGARGGPIVGLATDNAWEGSWGAIGGIPPLPVNSAPNYTFSQPGNIYSRRPHCLNFRPADSGSQQGFGQSGLGYILRRDADTELRIVRRIVEDAALRPIFVRDTSGAFVRDVLHQNTDCENQEPTDTSNRFGRPGAWPSTPRASGRQGRDHEHIRYRDLSAYLCLARDYQMRDVLRESLEIDLMVYKVRKGWLSQARGEGRQLLTRVEGWRLFSDVSENAVFGQHMKDQISIFETNWLGATALALNPNARELVVMAKFKNQVPSNLDSWAPWETSRAALGFYAASLAFEKMGDPVEADLARQRAYELARSVCMTLYQDNGTWRVPYRVAYAGGVTDYASGWIAPGSQQIDPGNSNWLRWSTSALDVFVNLYPVSQTHALDAALMTRVATVQAWMATNLQPVDWMEAHLYAPIT